MASALVFAGWTRSVAIDVAVVSPFFHAKRLSGGILALNVAKVPGDERRGGLVLTDDRAPVEWLTDRMLLEQIARAQGLDEAALPTEP